MEKIYAKGGVAGSIALCPADKNVAVTVLSYILLAMAVFSSCRMFPQSSGSQVHLHMGADAFVSGCGHGVFYSAFAGFSKDRHIVSVGPCIQGRSMLMRGGRLCYSYILTGYKSHGRLSDFMEEHNESIQLHFFSYAQYVDKLPFGYNAATREGELSGNERSCRSLRFSTAEIGAGVSLNVRVSKRIYWKNSVALSAYYNINCPNSTLR